MPDRGGLMLVLDEPDRAQRIIDRLEGSGEFSEALSGPDFQMSQSDLSLIVSDEAIRAAMLAQRGRKVATDKYRVRFSDLVELSPPLSLAELQQAISSSLVPH